MTTVALDLGAHVALLDPISGNGFLVLPPEVRDVRLDPMAASLHHANLLAALRELDRHGWEPSGSDDGGLLLEEERTAGGRRLAGLYGRDPVAGCLELEEHADSFAALLAHATERGL